MGGRRFSGTRDEARAAKKESTVPRYAAPGGIPLLYIHHIPIHPQHQVDADTDSLVLQPHPLAHIPRRPARPDKRGLQLPPHSWAPCAMRRPPGPRPRTSPPSRSRTSRSRHRRLLLRAASMHRAVSGATDDHGRCLRHYETGVAGATSTPCLATPRHSPARSRFSASSTTITQPRILRLVPRGQLEPPSLVLCAPLCTAVLVGGPCASLG